MKSSSVLMSNGKSGVSLLLTLLSALFLLLLLAPVEYSARLWGIHHLGYFSWSIRIIVIAGAIVAAVAVYLIARVVERKKTLKRVLVYFATPASLLAVFYLLRVRTHYLGDGILRADEIRHGVWLLPNEPLATAINAVSFYLTSRLFAFDAFQAVASVSLLAGVLFYFAALYLVRNLLQRPSERLLAMILLLFSGMTLLFCGYVESYLLLPAAITMFLAAGIRGLRQKGSILWSLFFFLLAVGLHVSSLYLSLAVLLLAYYAFRQKRAAGGIACLAAVAVALAAVLILPMLLDTTNTDAGRLIVPLSSSVDDYWLFSSQHLLDIANQLLLIGAPVLILLIGSLILRPERPPRGRVVMFAGVVLIGAIAFVSLLDPKLGYATDWDLFAPAGVAVILFALVWAASPGKLQLSSVASVAVMAAAMGVFLSYAVLNASMEKSIERQSDILFLSGERGGIGFEMMGKDLLDTGRSDLAERIWKRSVKLRPHRRTSARLAELMLSQERIYEAEYFAREGLKLDSTFASLHQVLGIAQVRRGNLQEAEKHLRDAVRLNPELASAYHTLCRCLLDQGRSREAEQAAREAVRLEPKNPLYRRLLATVLAAQGDREAVETLRTAIELDPADIATYKNLAELYVSLGKTNMAIEVLRDYLTRNPESVARSNIERLIGRLSN